MKGRVSKRLREKLKADAPPPPASVVRMNAEKDPSYCPYCMRCSGLVRMKPVAPMLWKCGCGAIHDERGSPLQSGAGSVGEEPSRPVRCLCGADAEYRKDAPQSSRWGDNPEVSFKADEWHCPKCGEVWFSPRMSDRYTTNLLKATIKALRSPLVSVEEPSVEQWIESPRSPDSPDIRGLLDELCIAAHLAEACECESMPCEHVVGESRVCASVESAFSVLREEVERLRGDLHEKPREERFDIPQDFCIDWDTTDPAPLTREEMLEMREALSLAQQLFRGWHHDNLWSDWDESVRLKVARQYLRLYVPQSAASALRSRLRGQTND